MKKGYRMHFRRRREGKTDYEKRFRSLKSGLNRLVVRISNTRVISQIIKYEKNGDATLIQATSDELKGLGWKHNTKNIPAAYLTGLLLANKVKKSNLKVGKLILDAGLKSLTKESRIGGVVKGAAEGGLEVAHSEKVLPSNDAISGKYIEAYRKIAISKQVEEIRKKLK